MRIVDVMKPVHEWRLPAVKALIWILALWPAGQLVWGIFNDGLGPNPVETLQRSTGWWALTLLCITLAVTPMRKWTHQPWLASLRRLLGLFMFFYACLHLLTWAGLDQRFAMDDMLHDIVKRPFIMIGMVAFTLLVPLAITSPRVVARRVGGARWRMIHRAVHAVAVLGVLHFWWMRTAKHNLEEPMVFAGVVATLLAARLLPWGWQRWRQGQAGGVSIRQA